MSAYPSSGSVPGEARTPQTGSDGHGDGAEAQRSPAALPAGGRGTQARRFLWHLLQMVFVMELGMSLFHAVAGKSLAAYPVLNNAGMQLSMIPPMVLLMRYHRHSWQRSLEMAAAMLAGPALLLACAQFGLHLYIPGLSRSTLFAWASITMSLGMLAIMLYRRAEYTADHAAHPVGDGGPACHGG